MTIDIHLTGDLRRLLKIPDRIEVPQFSEVRWNIRNLGNYVPYPRKKFRGLMFRLYFRRGSPFDWTERIVRWEDFLAEQPFNHYIQLANDVVKNIGDFKYGIRAYDMSYGTDEPIYDEDPFLIVY